MTFLNILILIIFIIIVPNYNILFHNRNKHSEERFIKFLIIISLILIIVAPLFPFILTGKERIRDFVGIGEIGDTIGGITAPFISIAAVIVTGLAFYAQYKANDMVKKQFEIQKFENQFYEMLRLHKENVNEIEVKDNNGNIIKGREAFLLMTNKYFIYTKKGFENAYKEFFWSNNFHSYLGHYYRHLLHTVKFVHKQDFLTEEQKLDYLRILRAQLSNYEQEMLFYNWLSGYGSKWEEIDPEEKILYIINKLNEYNPIVIQLDILNNHLNLLNSYLEELNNNEAKIELQGIIEILKQGETLSQNNENYLKELNKKVKKERENKNQFFTRYKMIHNLWYSHLVNDFIKTELEILKNRYTELEIEGELFEIDE